MHEPPTARFTSALYLSPFADCSTYFGIVSLSPLLHVSPTARSNPRLFDGCSFCIHHLVAPATPHLGVESASTTHPFPSNFTTRVPSYQHKAYDFSFIARMTRRLERASAPRRSLHCMALHLLAILLPLKVIRSMTPHCPSSISQIMASLLYDLTIVGDRRSARKIHEPPCFSSLLVLSAPSSFFATIMYSMLR